MPKEMCPVTQLCGDFIEPDRQRGEGLKIGFLPMSLPIQQRWRNNGLSADFLADYLGTFFPRQDDASTERQASIKGAISYIANELLENAMKFSYAPSQHPVSLEMYLDTDAVRLYVTNCVDPASLTHFQHLIQRLLTEDTDALYLEQLAQSTDAGSGSGLGFLTMINDYGARIAWKFTPLAEGPCAVNVTTMVYVPV